jgi:phage repressor protein C with HTH and peptisase S24 domain
MLAFGKQDNTAMQSLRKGSSPAFDRVAALAAALGLELYLGPPRDTSPVPTADAEDFVAVTRYAALASAGTGIENTDDKLEPVIFRRDWLRGIGVAPSRARLVTAAGRSMEPFIRDGDLVMFDTGKTVPPIRPSGRSRGHPSIYVLTLGSDTLVKSIDRPSADRLIISSENPDEGGMQVLVGDEIDTDLSIKGKVIWWGHTDKS